MYIIYPYLDPHFFYRSTHPELLHKKDRGRPTEAVVAMKRKGKHLRILTKYFKQIFPLPSNSSLSIFPLCWLIFF